MPTLSCTSVVRFTNPSTTWTDGSAAIARLDGGVRSTLAASERGEDDRMVGGVESTSNGAECTWVDAPRESSTSRCRTVSVALNPVGVQETTFEFPPGVEVRIDWLVPPL